VKIIIKSRK